MHNAKPTYNKKFKEGTILTFQRALQKTFDAKTKGGNSRVR